MSMLLRENVLYVRTVQASRKQPSKCKDSVAAYGRWSFAKIEPQGVSSEKRSRHICFMKDNLLHAMSKLGYVLFHVIAKVLRYSKYHSAHSANRDKRKCQVVA